jgi:hypothetical protein
LNRGFPDTNRRSIGLLMKATSQADERRRRLGNDKAVPLLSGAPPQVRERDHDDSHAGDIDETSEESKSS